MPATEQTWRDQKVMHVIFGVSSVLLLLATIWMLVIDHDREWKKIQRNARALDAWSTSARIDQTETPEFKAEVAKRAKALADAQAAVPKHDDMRDFEKALTDGTPIESLSKLAEPIVNLYKSIDPDQKAEKRTQQRGTLMSMLYAAIEKAKFFENNALITKKFRSADLDVAKSELDLAIENGAATTRLGELQSKVDSVKKDVDKKVQEHQELITRRKRMQAAYDRTTNDEVAAKKGVDELAGVVKRLQDAREERAYDWTKHVVDAPILSAFNAPSKIDNIWLPYLTINNNFREVARFDRCTTCHQSLDKTAVGSAVAPAYRPEETVRLSLATPAQAPSAKDSAEDRLLAAYGLKLVETDLFNPGEVRVSVVRAESAAAKAGLEIGDQIVGLNDIPKINLLSDVNSQLLDGAKWGQSAKVTVKRGFAHPYASHPRLDLYLGSMSPHVLKDVGCTICHDGQGSATAFKFASHTPNDPRQAKDWDTKYGWFSSHDWIFPMTSHRFIESNCLKCHHEVVELEPSERFPEPPAPKLVEGFNVVRQYGCFGCHEINGYDGPSKRLGPDLRAEPNYSFAAKALAASGSLNDQQKGWAKALAAHPESTDARRQLADSIKNIPADDPSVDAATRKLVSLLDDVESPGKLRKVGPSLRHIGSKVDKDFLYSWIRRPRDFRDTTKMPQFFGQYEHLDEAEKKHTAGIEAMEIRGITEYLTARSQPFAFEFKLPKDVEEPSIARGKKTFETRGCLACHQHGDFPAGKMTQGPNLSNIGGKLGRSANKNGTLWLYNWLKNPSAYHPRTVMPDLQLEPLMVDGKKVDPAADIVVYLLDSGKDWKPENVPSGELSEADLKSLNELAIEHLRNAVPNKTVAEKLLETGFPEARRSEIKGDEVELVGPVSNQKKLLYVGSKALRKYGCSGCHDIPGFEDAKPIGTGLADWGRKSADKLAFEQIAQYLHSHAGHDADHGDFTKSADQNEAYFKQRLQHHDRQGFLWQKLHEPRSYDYAKTANKGFNERLRMPKFNLSEEQIESVMTFVLGLVSEPPAQQYLYKPSGNRAAIVEGERLIEKYNCTGCHVLRNDRWDVALNAGELGEPSETPDFSFVLPNVNPKAVKASAEKDAAGRFHGTIVGSARANPENGNPLLIDEDNAPIEPGDTATRGFYVITPWQTTPIAGHVRQAGVQNLLIPADRITKHYPAWGGHLARQIFPTVVKDETAINPSAKDKADEAWGWLPPALVGEGRKVRSSWLHDFLLDPHAIRPAVVLRMPKFNMSSQEASSLAAYFAAVDGAEYPESYDERATTTHLADAMAKHPHQFDDALKIVGSGDGCVKCHIVGDFMPAGSDKAKAPQLGEVYKRIRPSYLKEWIANPKRILPYTAMPALFSPTQAKFQDQYKGDSVEQIDALVDLLSNFDRYLSEQTSMKPHVKAAPPAAATSQNEERSK
jgi:mono/diheme cytochrome c family protein/cytochrome c1